MAKTVLVIDDDPTQRRLLTAAVEKAGFACRTAPDGETGIAIATDTNAGADVILLDLHMPVLDGFGFLTELRGTPAWEDIPVVVVTGQDLTTSEREQLSLNVTRIFDKASLQVEEVLAELRRLLGRPAGGT